jgi:hypothetical protein
MKVDKVYLTTYRRDLRATKICVASIRYFCPDIPIHLIIDHSFGPFPMRQMAKAFGVKRHRGKWRHYRDMLSQIEPFLADGRQSFFLSDADVLFTGDIFAEVADCPERVVVQKEFIDEQSRENAWFKLKPLAQLDPDFIYPGWGFNAGQWFGTEGTLTIEDFRPWLTEKSIPALKHPDVFYVSQGIINYLLLKKAQTGELKLGTRWFALWAGCTDQLDQISLEAIKKRESDRLVIHWAGVRGRAIEDWRRSDIPLFFEQYYYSKVPFGKIQRRFDLLRDKLVITPRLTFRRMKRKLGVG